MLHPLVATALLLAAAQSTAGTDPARVALASVLTHDELASGCDVTALRAAAASASLRKLGRAGGDDVVLAEVQNPCLCGAQNCPYYVVQLTPGHPRALLSTFGVTLKLRAAATLPGIVVRAHDSAAIAQETAYAYRDGTYAVTSSERVRWADNARKPNLLPVRFAAGASSAQLHGSVSLGWYDEYVFDAAKGQKVLIDGVRSRSPLRLTVYNPHESMDIKAGVPYTLPRNATFRLHIDNGAESDVPYALTFAIR